MEGLKGVKFLNTRTSSLYLTLVQAPALGLEVAVLLAANVLLIASAYLSIELPFSPVPITGQTFGVLLVAMTLGSKRGTLVILAYLAEGILGLPVFASGKAGLPVLLGPTGGYLLGFLAAGWLVGRLAEHGWDRGYLRSVAAMSIGTALIFIVGLTQLSLFVTPDLLFGLGLTPFLPGALLKIGLAAIVLPSVWRFVRKPRK